MPDKTTSESSADLASTEKEKLGVKPQDCGIWKDPGESRFTTRLCRFHKEKILIVRTEYVLSDPRYKIGITGEGDYMGAWGSRTTIKGVEATSGSGVWTAAAMVPEDANVEFKCVVLDHQDNIIEWESESINRKITMFGSNIFISVPWGNTERYRRISHPPDELACVTFYTHNPLADKDESLVLHCALPGVSQWNASDTILAHNTSSESHWSAVALFPKHQQVQFKWGVLNRRSRESRYEDHHTRDMFTSSRYVILKTYDGSSMVKSHEMRILPDIDDRDRKTYGNGQKPIEWKYRHANKPRPYVGINKSLLQLNISGGFGRFLRSPMSDNLTSNKKVQKVNSSKSSGETSCQASIDNAKIVGNSPKQPDDQAELCADVTLPKPDDVTLRLTEHVHESRKTDPKDVEECHSERRGVIDVTTEVCDSVLPVSDKQPNEQGTSKSCFDLEFQRVNEVIEMPREPESHTPDPTSCNDIGECHEACIKADDVRVEVSDDQRCSALQSIKHSDATLCQTPCEHENHTVGPSSGKEMLGNHDGNMEIDVVISGAGNSDSDHCIQDQASMACDSVATTNTASAQNDAQRAKHDSDTGASQIAETGGDTQIQHKEGSAGKILSATLTDGNNNVDPLSGIGLEASDSDIKLGVASPATGAAPVVQADVCQHRKRPSRVERFFRRLFPCVFKQQTAP